MKTKERIKVRVHEAFFTGSDDRHLFVNIANTCKFRILTITHLYYECGEQKRVMDIISNRNHFPITLEASQCIEIAIPCSSLPFPITFEGFKVRTTDGKWYQSKAQHTLTSNVEFLILK